MKHFLMAVICALLLSISSIVSLPFVLRNNISKADEQKREYWFLLHRKSNIEYLYRGTAGEVTQSELVRTFTVKTGVPGQRPTPLPQKVGYQYWVIDSKEKVEENPETQPFFLRLNVPVSEEEPFGPTPYEECDGQCNWIVPGYFGLHGVGGDDTKLEGTNEGSSGCIRHTDEDITYLYNLLNPATHPVRYYIEDT